MKIILKIFPILVLLAVTTIFFGKTLTGEEIFVTPDFGSSDILHAEYPAKLFLSQSLKNKTLPLWNPYIASGFPQLGTISGNFNPANLVMFYFLPMPLAFNITLALSFLTAGLFTYLFARSVGLSRISSLFAAITFSYSGFLVTQINHFVVVQTLCFFPVALYIAEVFIQKKKVFLLPLLSIIFGLQILAGFYQIVLYTFIFLLIYSFLRIFLTAESQLYRWRLLVGIGLAMLGGFILSAIQLFPSWELTQISNRKGGVSFEEIKRFPYQIKHLVTFIWPYLLGDPRVGSYPRFSQNWGIFWESTGFVGILPIIFAFFAILRAFTKSKIVQIFTILLVLSLLLMLGKNSPTIFLYKIPPLSFFRVPARWIVFFAFSLTILGAIGFEIFLKSAESFLKNNVFKILLAYLILILAVANVFLFSMNYHLRGKTDEWLNSPETANFFKKDNSQFRVLTLGHQTVWNEQFLNKGWLNAQDKYLPFRQALDPNWNMVFEISQVDSYAPVTFFRDLLLTNIRQQEIQLKENNYIIAAGARNLLDIQNVKYIISPFKVTARDFGLVFTTQTNPQYFIYQNNTVFQRTYVASNYQVSPLINDALRVLNAPDFNNSSVILDKNLGERKFIEATSEAKITKYQNQHVEIEANLAEDGILVLADSFYPGWKAFVDGKQTEIIPANINQRAVVLEKGTHVVKFVFSPRSFKIGLTISLATLTLLISTLIFLFIKDKRSANES